MLFRFALATFLLGSATAAFAAPLSYYANLTGPAEAPPNQSPGTGVAYVTIDVDANTLRIIFNFNGLTAGTTAAHIHCCTATPGAGAIGVATVLPSFTGFTLGGTSGSYDFTYNTEASSGTWNPAFVTNNGGSPIGAETALANGLAQGRAYLNIHSSAFPGGEIRGFLQPVPEPSTWTVALGAAMGMAALRFRACRK